MTAYPFDQGLRTRLRTNLQRFEWREMPLLGRTAAAVALIVARNDAGQSCYLVTRRSAGLRSHGGQLALPGGRMDPDETPVECALRETREEIGLPLSESAVIGRLDDYATRSGYVMKTIVVWAERTDNLELNADEVAKVFRIPLATLDAPEVPKLVHIPESDQPVLQVPIFDKHINPPTAAIVFQLREVAMHGRDTRVAHYEQPVWAWR